MSRSLPSEAADRSPETPGKERKRVCNAWVSLPLTICLAFFLSLMAVERPHLHDILLLILSLKLLFIKDSLEEGTIESVQVLTFSTCEYYFIRQRCCICD